VPVWVSLLRAVNLGARNKVNMPALREALMAAGFDDVRTYVQSGNVVTRSPHRSADKVGAAVRAVVRDDFGFDTPVVVRSPKQLAEILAWNPFPEDAAAHPTTVQVLHLVERPARDKVEALLAQDIAPEKVAVKDREVVLSYADGLQGSRLQPANVLKRLGVDGTGRNWRTLSALVDLTSTT
jgi:uncharacterized protein (DUF1697 family)